MVNLILFGFITTTPIQTIVVITVTVMAMQSFLFSTRIFLLARRLTRALESDSVSFFKPALRNQSARWKIAMHHHPVFTSDENDFGDTWRSPALHQGDPEVRADWLDIYEQYDVDLVLYGHMHIYERSRPMVAGRVEHHGGVVYVGAGGAGGNLEDFAPTRNAYTRKTFRGYHYGLVDVTQGRLAITIRDTEGRVRDRFTIPAGEARSRK